MKKILLLLLITISLVILPLNAFASDTITVYLFRGETCEHCHEALEYISEHREEIPENVEIVTYEVWENTNNRTLHNEVAAKLGLDEDQYNTVPLFVVGDKHILGYNSTTWDTLFEYANEYTENSDYEDIVSSTLEEINVDARALTLDDLYSEPSMVATIIVYCVFGAIVLGIILMKVFTRK